MKRVYLHKKKYVGIVTKLVLVFFSFIVIFAAFRDSHEIRNKVSAEPENLSYTFDGLSFLKTFYQMEKGKSFYEANYIGIANDGRQGPLPIFISGWRLSTIFFIWRIFASNGVHIWLLFIFVSLMALWAAYDVAAFGTTMFSPFLAAIFLLPYFYFAAVSYQFLLVEWWAAAFFLISAPFLIRRHYFIASIFILLAALTREMYVIPIILGLTLSVLHKKRKNFIYFSMTLTIFLLFYLMHYWQASKILFTKTGMHLQFLGQDLGRGGFDFLRRTLAYGTQYFFTTKFGIQASLIILVITVISGIFLLLRNKIFDMQFLFGSLFLFILTFFLFGKPDNDYWGILYVPLMFALFPKALDFLFKKYVSNSKK